MAFAKVAKIRVAREADLENRHTISPLPHVELIFRECKNHGGERHLPRSEHKTAQVYSITTWSLIRRQQYLDVILVLVHGMAYPALKLFYCKR